VPQGQESAYPKEVRHLLLPSAKVNPKWSVILDLKYTKTVFEQNYDHFVFLDSDILWFLDDFNPQLNQYCEDIVPLSDPWCSHGWSFVPEHTIKGVNAGFFSVDKQTGLDMIGHIHANIRQIDVWVAPSEQSMFNLYLYEMKYKNWQPITNKFVLFAEDGNKFEDGKIYHFMGFVNHMNGKLQQMEGFLANNASEELVKSLID
jgi:hypothetical protein